MGGGDDGLFEAVVAGKSALQVPAVQGVGATDTAAGLLLAVPGQ